nr:hypothetical protein [Sodalis-like endosymbiont of Proechinophthirus fluctus]
MTYRAFVYDYTDRDCAHYLCRRCHTGASGNILADNKTIMQVIRRVSTELGLTAGKKLYRFQYQPLSSILYHLYELYSQPRSACWVIELHG